MILNKQISLWLSTEMYQRLCEASIKANVSKSHIIRMAIFKEVQYILSMNGK